jgi:ADP-ribose pyrophosphatase YjhB (NUDIX family)
MKTHEVAQRILAIANAGINYSKDFYDIERFKEIYGLGTFLLSTNDEEQAILSVIEKGYPTPKIDVRGVVRKDKSVLLVQDSGSGLWALPGGFAEVGFTPKENVEKEVLEETGFVVQANQLLAIYDTNKQGGEFQIQQYYKLVFQCKVLSGKLQTSIETSDVQFFSLEQLPPLSTRRTTKKQLDQLLTETKFPIIDEWKEEK